MAERFKLPRQNGMIYLNHPWPSNGYLHGNPSPCYVQNGLVITYEGEHHHFVIWRTGSAVLWNSIRSFEDAILIADQIRRYQQAIFLPPGDEDRALFEDEHLWSSVKVLILGVVLVDHYPRTIGIDEITRRARSAYERLHESLVDHINGYFGGVHDALQS